jgi:hypothetical protein
MLQRLQRSNTKKASKRSKPVNAQILTSFLISSASQDFFTVGYRAVYRGNRCYRWGAVTVPSGSNRSQISNLNSKNGKINKSFQKIANDL